MSAKTELVGYVPGPPASANQGVSDILHGSLLAYAVSSVVSIVDVRDMHLTGILDPGVNSGLVSALCWFPDCYRRTEPAVWEEGHLQLAAGDNLGRVLLWDVLSVTSKTLMHEAPERRAEALRAGKLAAVGGVRDMVWVHSNGVGLLAVAQDPGTLLLLNPCDGSQVWKREWQETICCLTRDPLNYSQIALCTDQGGVMVLRLQNPGRNRVDSSQYRMGGSKGHWYPTGESSSPAVLSCMFAWTRELLFTLTQAQVAVFDMELHGLAASIQLPSDYANFSQLLALQPRPDAKGSAYGNGQLGGLEILLCAHQNGVVSLWACANSNVLQYTLSATYSLLPSPPRTLAGATMQIMSLKAARWRRPCAHGEQVEDGSTPEQPPSVGVTPPKRHRRRPPDAKPADPAPDVQQVPQTTPAQLQWAGGLPGPSNNSMLLAVVTSDGRVWTWDVDVHHDRSRRAVPAGPLSAPLLPRPRLRGLLPALPRSISTFTVCPTPIAASTSPQDSLSRAVVKLAAVTGTGMVEIISLRAGLGRLLTPVVSVALEVHRDVVRGLRWLGTTPRLVTFSCKKEKHGWRNSILVTDMRSRKSLSFRDVGPEVSPMLAIRASPSGRHLLVLFRGAPSEIWVVSDQAEPQRVRVLDLPFTAVEWVLPSDAAHAPDTPSKWTTWTSPESSPPEGLSPGDPDANEDRVKNLQDQLPEERLAFALGDGRVGVLSVKGRRIGDTKPKRPTQGLLASNECVCMALAAWGTNVVLGDAEGNIVRWDTSTGRSSSIATAMGAVRRVQVAPCRLLFPHAGSRPPSMSDPIARIAVLFSPGSWGVWELDARNGIRHVASGGNLETDAHAPPSSPRVTDLYWLPLPMPGGNGGVLAAGCEDASLSFIHVEEGPPLVPAAGSVAATTGSGPSTPATLTPATARRATLEGAAFRAALVAEGHAERVSAHDKAAPLCALMPAPRQSCSVFLPTAAQLFFRLMLQIGVPAAAITEDSCNDGLWQDGGERASDGNAGGMERRLWELLPEPCRQLSLLWKGESAGSGRQRKPLSSLSFAQISSRTPLCCQVQDGRPPPAPLAIPSSGASGEILPIDESLPTSGRDNGMAQPDFDLWNGANTSGDGIDLAKLFACLRAIRCGTLLEPGQVAAYAATLQTSNSLVGLGEEEVRPPSSTDHSDAVALAARMTLIAEVAGEPDEVAFWEGLVPTLASLRDRCTRPSPRHIATPEWSSTGQDDSDEAEETSQWDQHRVAAAAVPGAELPQSPRHRRIGEGHPLWSPMAVIREAQKRAQWHERLARAGPASAATSLSPDSLQAQQVLEYVTLGDFQTAVGFLLASTPEQTTKYFRNALCTISLAAANSPGNASTSLHMQAAKVVAANAAAMGDTQLGVPLLCSVGLPAEAVTLLQDSGQWRHATTLAASQLAGPELSAALERWAMHVVASEGCFWRGLGLLTAGGCCRTCIRVMKIHKHADSAVAYLEICKLMGAPVREDGRDSMFTPAPSPMQAPLDAADASFNFSRDLDTTHQEFAIHVEEVLTAFADLASHK